MRLPATLALLVIAVLLSFAWETQCATASEKLFLEGLLSTGCNWPSGWTLANLGVGNTDCPQWPGIFCVNGNGSIEQITIEDQPLLCAIPRNWTALTEVTSISLIRSLLTGELPPLIFTPKLRHLDLRGSKLTGTIPHNISQLSPNLEGLFLKSNLITGVIPPNILELPLRYLNLFSNYLECPIPAGLHDYFESLPVDPYNVFSLAMNDFGNPGDSTICGTKMPPSRLAKYLPTRTHGLFAEAKKPNWTPSWVLENSIQRMEMHGRTLFLFSKTKSGVLFREEFIAFEFQGIHELPQRWVNANSGIPVDEFGAYEFPFHDTFPEPVQDPLNLNRYVSTYPLVNGSTFELKLELGNPTLRSPMKFSWQVSNWDFIEPGNYIGFPAQVTMRWQLFQPGEELACLSLLGFGECSTGSSHLQYLILSEGAKMILRNPRTEMNLYFPYDLILDGTNHSQLLFQTHAFDSWENSIRTTTTLGNPLDTQELTYVVTTVSPPFKTTTFYDPEFSINLLFDISSPDEEETKSVVGIGVGVGVAAVVAAAVVIGLVVYFKPWRSKVTPFRDREVDSTALHSSPTNAEMQQKAGWKASVIPRD